jgi:hypothetical protein
MVALDLDRERFASTSPLHARAVPPAEWPPRVCPSMRWRVPRRDERLSMVPHVFVLAVCTPCNAILLQYTIILCKKSQIILNPKHLAWYTRSHKPQLTLQRARMWQARQITSKQSLSQSLTTTSPLGAHATPSHPHSPRCGACSPLPTCSTQISQMWREQKRARP